MSGTQVFILWLVGIIIGGVVLETLIGAVTAVRDRDVTADEDETDDAP